MPIYFVARLIYSFCVRIMMIRSTYGSIQFRSGLLLENDAILDDFSKSHGVLSAEGMAKNVSMGIFHPSTLQLIRAYLFFTDVKSGRVENLWSV